MRVKAVFLRKGFLGAKKNATASLQSHWRLQILRLLGRALRASKKWDAWPRFGGFIKGDFKQS